MHCEAEGMNGHNYEGVAHILVIMEGVANSARDLLSGVQCVATGCYHSLLGILPVFHLVKQSVYLSSTNAHHDSLSLYRNAKIRKQLLQCFLLNGVILCVRIVYYRMNCTPLYTCTDILILWPACGRQVVPITG